MMVSYSNAKNKMQMNVLMSSRSSLVTAQIFICLSQITNQTLIKCFEILTMDPRGCQYFDKTQRRGSVKNNCKHALIKF